MKKGMFIQGILAASLMFSLILAGCSDPSYNVSYQKPDPNDGAQEITIIQTDAPEVTVKAFGGAGFEISWYPVKETKGYEVYRYEGAASASNATKRMVDLTLYTLDYRTDGKIYAYDIVQNVDGAATLTANTSYTYEVVTIPIVEVRDDNKGSNSATNANLASSGTKLAVPKLSLSRDNTARTMSVVIAPPDDNDLVLPNKPVNPIAPYTFTNYEITWELYDKDNTQKATGTYSYDKWLASAAGGKASALTWSTTDDDSEWNAAMGQYTLKAYFTDLGGIASSLTFFDRTIADATITLSRDFAADGSGYWNGFESDGVFTPVSDGSKTVWTATGSAVNIAYNGGATQAPVTDAEIKNYSVKLDLNKARGLANQKYNIARNDGTGWKTLTFVTSDVNGNGAAKSAQADLFMEWRDDHTTPAALFQPMANIGSSLKGNAQRYDLDTDLWGNFNNPIVYDMKAPVKKGEVDYRLVGPNGDWTAVKGPAGKGKKLENGKKLPIKFAIGVENDSAAKMRIYHLKPMWDYGQPKNGSGFIMDQPFLYDEWGNPVDQNSWRPNGTLPTNEKPTAAELLNNPGLGGKVDMVGDTDTLAGLLNDDDRIVVYYVRAVNTYEQSAQFGSSAFREFKKQDLLDKKDITFGVSTEDWVIGGATYDKSALKTLIKIFIEYADDGSQVELIAGSGADANYASGTIATIDSGFDSGSDGWWNNTSTAKDYGIGAARYYDLGTLN